MTVVNWVKLIFWQPCKYWAVYNCIPLKSKSMEREKRDFKWTQHVEYCFLSLIAMDKYLKTICLLDESHLKILEKIDPLFINHFLCLILMILSPLHLEVGVDGKFQETNASLALQLCRLWLYQRKKYGKSLFISICLRGKSFLKLFLYFEGEFNDSMSNNFSKTIFGFFLFIYSL